MTHYPLTQEYIPLKIPLRYGYLERSQTISTHSIMVGLAEEPKPNPITLQPQFKKTIFSEESD
jgi:hypothetical protein